MNIISKIAQELNIKENQVHKTVQLIDEGNTIPFIARYRKEVTGNLSDEILRDLNERLTYLRNLEQRKAEVKSSIENQGKLTDEIISNLEKAETLAEVEDIYRPYKQKKKTRGTVAKAKGLEKLAQNILEQNNSSSIYEEAKKYIRINTNIEMQNLPTDSKDSSTELQVLSAEEALSGAKDIIAEQISDDTEYRTIIKKLYYREGFIETEAINPEENTTYNMYYEFKEKISTIPSHRILAINRGEKEEILKVRIEKPEEKIFYNIARKIIKNKNYTNNLSEK